MKIIYLDESGVGNPQLDKVVTVAGIIVDADRQCKSAEHELARIRNEVIPRKEWPGFVFHATDLFHGNGAFSKARMSQEARLSILDEICRLPHRLGMHVIFHFGQRDYLRTVNPAATEKEITEAAHSSAYLGCALGVEQFMRKRTPHGEVAMLVHEDTDQRRGPIRKVHNALRCSPASMSGGLTPFRRIIEAPLFALKQESCLLQFADAAAFAVNRCFRDAPAADRFFNILMAEADPPFVPTDKFSSLAIGRKPPAV